jgi:diacylglycerol kinase family enzyme
MKYIIISNPLSGSFDERKISAFYQELETIGIDIADYRLKNSEKIGDVLGKLSKEEKYCLVFACGDGTINSAVNAIINGGYSDNIIITVLPMGTANVLARELNIRNYHDVLRAIKNDDIVKMSLFKAENSDGISKLCLLMASVGIDSIAVRTVNDNLKNKIGKWAYIVLFLKNIFKTNRIRLLTRIEGNEYRNVLTCVCNGKYYGGRFKIAGNDLGNNSFDVIVIKKLGLLSCIKYYVTGKTRNISLIRAKSVEILGEKENYPLQLDGDYFCSTPVSIEVIEAKISALRN